MTQNEHHDIARRLVELRRDHPSLDDVASFHRLVDDLVWCFGKSECFNRHRFYFDVYDGRHDLCLKALQPPDVRGYSPKQKERRLRAG